MPVINNKSQSDRIQILQNKTIYNNYLSKKIIQSGSDSTKQESARIPVILGSVETPCDINTITIPKLTTKDLLIHFEANNTSSYPGSGTTWINIGTGGATYNATLLGSSESSDLPTFVNGSIKSFHFIKYPLNDGSSYLYFNYMSFLRPAAISDDFTWCAWINTTETGYGLNHYNLMYIVSTETGDVNDDFGFGIDANGKLEGWRG